jgi:hypothetical protein
LTEEAVLGQSYEYDARSFQLEVDRALTDDERDVLRSIALVMKPVNTHFAGFVEPDPGQIIDHWEIGLSSLDENTDLHN